MQKCNEKISEKRTSIRILKITNYQCSGILYLKVTFAIRFLIGLRISAILFELSQNSNTVGLDALKTFVEILRIILGLAIETLLTLSKKLFLVL